MARSTPSTTTPAKEPGRLKQMWRVLQMTRRLDRNAVWYIGLAFALPVLVGVLAAVTIGGNVLGVILWVLVGVLGGVLAATIVLSRRAEKAAYSQIEGQPGAVGAVLRSALRRGWRGSEIPVAVNGKTQDAVYRAVGRPGVVLLVEGPVGRTKRIVDDERRKVARIVPNVAIEVVRVGTGDGEVRLHRINRSLGRLKRTLTKAEVVQVSNRLASLGTQMPIPKGIDPTKVRAPRPR